MMNELSVMKELFAILCFMLTTSLIVYAPIFIGEMAFKGKLKYLLTLEHKSAWFACAMVVVYFWYVSAAYLGIGL